MTEIDKIPLNRNILVNLTKLLTKAYKNIIHFLGGALFAFRDFGSARDHSLWVLPSAPQSGAIVAGDLLLVPLIPIDRRNSPSNSRPRRTASPTFPSAFHLLQDFIRSTTGQFEH